MKREIKVGDTVRLLPLTKEVVRSDYELSPGALALKRRVELMAGHAGKTVEVKYFSDPYIMRPGMLAQIEGIGCNWPISCLELVEEKNEDTAASEQGLPPGYYRTEEGFITCDDNWAQNKRWF